MHLGNTAKIFSVMVSKVIISTKKIDLELWIVSLNCLRKRLAMEQELLKLHKHQKYPYFIHTASSPSLSISTSFKENGRAMKHKWEIQIIVHFPCIFHLYIYSPDTEHILSHITQWNNKMIHLKQQKEAFNFFSKKFDRRIHYWTSKEAKIRKEFKKILDNFTTDNR